MAAARAERQINKPAVEVWALIGDFSDLSWFPNVESLQLDGDIRTSSSVTAS